MISSTTPASDVLSHIHAAGIVAVIRSDTAAAAYELAVDVADAGIRAVEVALTTPDAVDVIARLTARLDGEVVVGAGTIPDVGALERCLEAAGCSMDDVMKVTAFLADLGVGLLTVHASGGPAMIAGASRSPCCGNFTPRAGFMVR